MYFLPQIQNTITSTTIIHVKQIVKKTQGLWRNNTLQLQLQKQNLHKIVKQYGKACNGLYEMIILILLLKHCGARNKENKKHDGEKYFGLKNPGEVLLLLAVSCKEIILTA